MHGFVVFFLFFSFLCSEPFGYGERLNGFSLELIHRDSPLSPFYNSSKSISELRRNAIERSISRVSRSLLGNEKESSPESVLIPGGAEYLMKFYIGTPPVERFAFADTGSDLIWLQCSPCDNNNCFQQDTPYYDPTKSSTFTLVPFDSQPCTYIPQDNRSPGNAGQCEYGYSYLDKSYTYGELGFDYINFGDDISVTFPRSVFGCGHNNKFTFDSGVRSTGLVGLGAGPLSLVSQLGDVIGRKFSYCLVPFDSNTTSKMKFGSEATISGNGVVYTPLIIKPSQAYYFLNLEGVTIGLKTVQTAPQTDNNNNIGGNIIIDSGTTFTYLEPNLYNDFVTLFKETIGVEATPKPPLPFSVCFNADADQMNFSDDLVVFHFTGADVTLMPINLLFEFEKNLFCLMVEPTSVGGIAIFGNMAQVDFQVGYDLEGKTVSFAPTDCNNS